MNSDPNLREPPETETEYELPLEIAFSECLRTFPVHHIFDEIDTIDTAVTNRHEDTDCNRGS